MRCFFHAFQCTNGNKTEVERRPSFYMPKSGLRRKTDAAHKKSDGSRPVKSVGGFMKRQELKNLLHGVENSGDIIDAIMELNGADIENAKKNAGTEHDTLTAEIESLREQLKAYGEGGAE